jgi:hypothetical protein
VKSFFRAASDSSKVAQRTIIDAYATHANRIVLDDKSYKQNLGGADGGGGDAAPPNPCGG